GRVRSENEVVEQGDLLGRARQAAAIVDEVRSLANHGEDRLALRGLRRELARRGTRGGELLVHRVPVGVGVGPGVGAGVGVCVGVCVGAGVGAGVAEEVCVGPGVGVGTGAGVGPGGDDGYSGTELLLK